MSEIEPLDDSPFVFAEDEDADIPISEGIEPWVVLVVDDDDQVHQLTAMVLRDFSFENRPLQLLNAHSASEAREILHKQSSIALILLDVVMESDNAGLELVRYIREQLNNHMTRIILRTGQAGNAPERDVILQYDINDYKEKTELTSQKLLTAVIASLRSYMYIEQVVTLNRELEQKVAERTEALQFANAQLQKSLTELQQGEEAGKRIQFKLLPESPFQVKGLTFSHLLHPSDFMSGDFVDYFAIDDQHTGFYMADVAGHGVSSAFLTVYLKRFVSTLMEGFTAHGDETICDPAALLTLLNQQLLEDDLGKHIALFYGVINHRQNIVTFTNAGIHPWPLIVTKEHKQWLEHKGTPAGLFEFSEYHNSQMSLKEEYDLYLFSDGVLEVLEEESVDEKMQSLMTKVTFNCSDMNTWTAESLGVKPGDKLPDDLTLLHIRAC